MDPIMYVLGGILLVAALFLIVAVLMQNSKSHKLSGTIAGGAETFFGKTKGADVNKKLNTATIVVAIIFVILVLVMYIIQPDVDYTVNPNEVVSDTVVADESESVSDTVVADESEVVSDTVADESEVVSDTVADESEVVSDTVADESEAVSDTVAEDETVSE